ncbi:MAG TPA: hypothetical protein VD993_06850 [Chitinophagaceae bacterium]|nr:hypothetical protein [Chitinophagaceae bacterium]
MKKWLVGSLVGAAFLFFWQFISWGVSGLHDGEYKHHPQQEQIISSLSGFIKEDGQYMIPREAPGATNAEREAAMQQMIGKPWAVVNYKASHEHNMTMSMIRGFLVDLVIVLLLISVLGKRTDLSMGSVWMGSLAIGFIGYLWNPYTQHIWFQTPDAVITGALIDWLVAYSILGLWLGFWLKRVSTNNRP